MRRSGILSLRRADVKGSGTTKNGKPRAVPLSSKAREAIAELPPSVDGRLFPISGCVLDHRWRKACAAAGTTDLHFQDLRHEAVSRLFEKGLTTEEVMAVSGHKTYAMLARYTHLRVSDLAAKLE
jgi:integrase